MAGYQIDELSLKIDIKGATKNKANNIRDIADAIGSLNESVSDSGALNNLKEYSDSLQKMAISIRESFKDIGKTAAEQLAPTITPKMIEVGDNSTKQNTDKLPKAATKPQVDYKKIIEDTTGITRANEEFSKSAEESAKYLEIFANKGEKVSSVIKYLDDGTTQLTETYKSFNKGLERTTTVVNGVATSVSEVTKPIKKVATGWSKFVKSIGRIAMYRAIRSVIKSITQAMIEGVQNYAKYSESANKAISNVRNSFQQIKDNFGVTLGYLLETFEPVITAISDSVVQFADNINMALAAMQGKSTFSKAIKQNEDYAKSLDKVNSKLLSFDKFESLNNGDQGNSTRYEEVEIGKTLNDSASALKALFEIVGEVLDVIKDIFELLMPSIQELLPMLRPIISSIASLAKTILPIIAKILEPIITLLQPIMVLLESIFQILETIINLVMPALEIIINILSVVFEYIGGLAEHLAGAVKVIGGLIKLLTGDFQGAWKNIGDGFKSMISGLINMFIAFGNFVISILNVLLKPIDKIVSVIGKIFGKDWGVQISKIPQFKGFANGGVPEVGTMFYAGEAGAEIVSSSRGGRTGVSNVEQISQAFLQALINYNAAQNNQSGGDVYIDGTKVGRLVENSVYNQGVRVGHFKRV